MIVKCPICNISYDDYSEGCSKALHTTLGDGWEFVGNIQKEEGILISCRFTSIEGQLIVYCNKKIKIVKIKPPLFIY